MLSAAHSAGKQWLCPFLQHPATIPRGCRAQRGWPSPALSPLLAHSSILTALASLFNFIEGSMMGKKSHLGVTENSSQAHVSSGLLPLAKFTSCRFLCKLFMWYPNFLSTPDISMSHHVPAQSSLIPSFWPPSERHCPKSQESCA